MERVAATYSAKLFLKHYYRLKVIKNCKTMDRADYIRKETKGKNLVSN